MLGSLLLRSATVAGALLLFFTSFSSAQSVAAFGTQFTAHELSLPLVLSRETELSTPLLPPPQLPNQRRKLTEVTWKTNIVATVFWVGEEASKRNPVSNIQSSWDPTWMSNFGGVDDPDGRSASYYGPAGFVPKQNPFYVALPYNDVMSSSQTKPDAAKVIPWFRSSYKKAGQSVCHNHWIAIRFRGRVCYAQWSDCGPFVTTDAEYVFGESPPVNTQNGGAGLDLSPAVRDYLKFSSGEKCEWRFVELDEVEEGPWRNFGANNPFTQGFDAWNTPNTPFVPDMDPPSMEPVDGAGGSSVPAKSHASSSNSKSGLTGTARMAELKKQRAAWFGDGAKKAK